jgi:hypothetical protein
MNMRGSVLLILLFYSTTIMASSIEKQKYRLVQAEEKFEVRYYPPATLARVYTSSNSYSEISTPGFRKLAGFIFGGNETNTKISMTAPVHMDINDTLSTMSFVMPSKYRMQDLPAPNDKSVILETSEAEYVAVLRFSGYASDSKISHYSEKLSSALNDQGISHYGNFRYLGYNPPYQFIGRKNEIIVTIDWSEDKSTAER